LIGISFGGLNAAFFAAKSNYFNGLAILSPITYPCADLNQTLVFSTYQNYKVYLSTGKVGAEHYRNLISDSTIEDRKNKISKRKRWTRF